MDDGPSVAMTKTSSFPVREAGEISATEVLLEPIAAVARDGPAGLRGFAAWLVDQPEELAFHSVRALAQRAGTSPNTVVRTLKAAGFPSYSAARGLAQQALRQVDQGYVARVGALHRQSSDALLAELSTAAHSNVEQVFAPATARMLAEAAQTLVSARRVICIGVRMGFALAQYFSYRGGAAHAHVSPTPAQPGLILDSLADTGPEDVVVVISFAHYSSEVVRAASIAGARGARVLAITDRPYSPLAQGAWRVLFAPVAGPNVMYSISGALLLLEALLELMAAADPAAQQRIETFERQLLDIGAYVGGTTGPRVPARR